MNILAWDYRIRLEERAAAAIVALMPIVMINRSNCGYLYLRVRGEILGDTVVVYTVNDAD